MNNKRVHRIVLILSLIVLKSLINLCAAKDKNENLHQALSIIVEQKFIRQNANRLLFYANFDKSLGEQTFCANDLIDGMLPYATNVTYMILYHRQKLFFNFKQNEVVLMDNVKTFRHFYRQMKNIGNMDLALTLLFISSLKTLDYETIYLIFKDLYYMEMIRVALVVRLANEEIVMLTYFPFTSTSCRDFKPVIINRYLPDLHRWENNDYFPEKFKDFYSCPVYCCTWQDAPYLTVKYNKLNPNATTYVGLEAELLKFLAYSLNFSIQIYWIDPIRADVGNSESIFSKIFSKHCDIALGAFIYRKDLDSTSTFSQTRPFLFSHIYIVTNAIKFYTMYEKLVFPFHYTVWFAFGLTFALSSLLICICGRRRNWAVHRNFLIGTANNTPHFHLYALAVGANMTMTHMPKRNFARFLLTCWILLTFILRIAYQSGVYQMLRDNKQWNPPQTIQNVFEQKYLISMIPESHKYLSILPATQRVRHFDATALEVFRNMLNAQEPIAFVVPYEYFGYFGRTNRSEWRNLHLVKERLLTQQLSIYVRHHSYLVPVINEKITIALNYGFIAQWKRKNILPRPSVLKHITETSSNKHFDKKPLSMKELGAIFMILVWLHVLSFVVFTIELMWHRYENAAKTFFNS